MRAFSFFGSGPVPWHLAVLVFLGSAATSRAEDWPQWRGPNRDGVWNETGLLDRFRTDRSLGSGACRSARAIAARRWLRDGCSSWTGCSNRVKWNGFFVLTSRRAQLWDQPYPCLYDGVSYTAGPRASVTDDEGRAYALGTMGHLHCLDVRQGQSLAT